MTEDQRNRRLRRIQLVARRLGLEPPARSPDPDLIDELDIHARASKHDAASEWFSSPGYGVVGRGNMGRPFWRGRW